MQNRGYYNANKLHLLKKYFCWHLDPTQAIRILIKCSGNCTSCDAHGKFGNFEQPHTMRIILNWYSYFIYTSKRYIQELGFYLHQKGVMKILGRQGLLRLLNCLQTILIQGNNRKRPGSHGYTVETCKYMAQTFYCHIHWQNDHQTGNSSTRSLYQHVQKRADKVPYQVKLAYLIVRKYNKCTSSSWFDDYCQKLRIHSAEGWVPWRLWYSDVVITMFSLQGCAVHMPKFTATDHTKRHLQEDRQREW